MEQTKEVAVKAKNAVAISDMQAEMMGAMDYSEVETKDLKIPKLLLMQAMSKYVNETHVAASGDLVNSVTAEVYGNVREKDYSAVRVVPIHMYKNWVVQEVLPPAKKGGKEKLEYKETVPVTPENTDWEWNVEENGRKFKRTKCMNFYVLLEKDIGNPMALPHVITFRSTSFKEGGVIANHFALCQAAKQAKQFRIPMDRYFEIGGKSMTNDEGTFFVLTAKEVGPTSEQAQGQAFSWYKNIKKQKLDQKVDNSEFDGVVGDGPVEATAETEEY